LESATSSKFSAPVKKPVKMSEMSTADYSHHQAHSLPTPPTHSAREAVAVADSRVNNHSEMRNLTSIYPNTDINTA